jgi:hypothetical protein
LWRTLGYHTVLWGTTRYCGVLHSTLGTLRHSVVLHSTLQYSAGEWNYEWVHLVLHAAGGSDLSELWSCTDAEPCSGAICACVRASEWGVCVLECGVCVVLRACGVCVVLRARGVCVVLRAWCCVRAVACALLRVRCCVRAVAQLRVPLRAIPMGSSPRGRSTGRAGGTCACRARCCVRGIACVGVRVRVRVGVRVRVRVCVGVRVRVRVCVRVRVFVRARGCVYAGAWACGRVRVCVCLCLPRISECFISRWPLRQTVVNWTTACARNHA